MSKIIPFIVLLMTIISCQKDNSSPCFVSSGEKITEERTLPYFNALEINDIFKVILVQDSVYKVVLEGDENLLPYVSCNVTEESVLELDHDISCKWTREYERITIYISFDSISDIITNTACELSTSTPLSGYEIRYWPVADMNIADLEINCQRFFLKSSYSATGSINLSGTCHHLQLWAFGSLAINAENLNSTLTYVIHKSIADFYVHPIYHLNAEIHHTGNVYYQDDLVQSLIKETFSTGQLIAY